MAARKITERRAADAARQLLYHQRLSEWISRKTVENEAILECYLIGSGEEREPYCSEATCWSALARSGGAPLQTSPR
jgi:hypothetical protein